MRCGYFHLVNNSSPVIVYRAGVLKTGISVLLRRGIVRTGTISHFWWSVRQPL